MAEHTRSLCQNANTWWKWLLAVSCSVRITHLSRSERGNILGWDCTHIDPMNDLIHICRSPSALCFRWCDKKYKTQQNPPPKTPGRPRREQQEEMVPEMGQQDRLFCPRNPFNAPSSQPACYHPPCPEEECSAPHAADMLRCRGAFRTIKQWLLPPADPPPRLWLCN